MKNEYDSQKINYNKDYIYGVTIPFKVLTDRRN